MEINEDPRSFGHDMCLGSPTIALLCKSRRVALLGCQDGQAIRWSQWHWDAELKDPEHLATWLANRGFPSQLKQVLEAEKQAEPNKKAWASWQAECPQCLSLHDLREANRLGSAERTGAFRTIEPCAVPEELIPSASAINKYYTSHIDAIRDLLKWAGHDTDLERDNHAYEMLPDLLLDSYSLNEIVEAIRKTEDPKVLDGAIRYFTILTEGTSEPFLNSSLDKIISGEIRSKLLARAEASGKRMRSESLKRLFKVPKSDAQRKKWDELEKFLPP
jgi:hypothetical protein